MAELQGALPELEGLGEAAEAAKGAALAEKKGLQATLEAEVAKALGLRADLSGAEEKLREAGNTIAHQPYTVEEIARIAGLDVNVVREGVGRFAAEGWVELK